MLIPFGAFFVSYYASATIFVVKTLYSQGVIFSIGFDLMTVIFPGGRFIQQPLFQRYPKSVHSLNQLKKSHSINGHYSFALSLCRVRKLLESVFEAFPQSILQIIIVANGFVEDENLGLLTFSIIISLMSMAKNIFQVYSDSKDYDDMNFCEYVVSIMSATFDQGGSLMKHAAEIRDGLVTVSFFSRWKYFLHLPRTDILHRMLLGIIWT